MKKSIKSIIKEEIQRGLREEGGKTIDVILNISGMSFEVGDKITGYVDGWARDETDVTIMKFEDDETGGTKRGSMEIPGAPDYDKMEATVVQISPTSKDKFRQARAKLRVDNEENTDDNVGGYGNQDHTR